MPPLSSLHPRLRTIHPPDVKRTFGEIKANGWRTRSTGALDTHKRHFHTAGVVVVSEGGMWLCTRKYKNNGNTVWSGMLAQRLAGRRTSLGHGYKSPVQPCLHAREYAGRGWIIHPHRLLTVQNAQSSRATSKPRLRARDVQPALDLQYSFGQQSKQVDFLVGCCSRAPHLPQRVLYIS